jgi:hypothetical protein
VHRLRDLCGRSGSLPEAYFLAHDITLLDNNPVSHGGFSDVYRGLCAGRPVALKVLRVSSDDQEDVKKVRSGILCCRIRADPFKRLSAKKLLYGNDFHIQTSFLFGECLEPLRCPWSAHG